LLWNLQCVVAASQGRTEDALDAGMRAVDLSRSRGGYLSVVNALGWLALAQTLSGHTADASNTAEEIVALTLRFPNRHLTEGALTQAAYALGASDLDRAIVVARDAVSLCEEGQYTLAWAALASLQDRHGDRRNALQSFARAIEAAHWQGNRTVVGALVARAGDLVSEGDPEAAAVLHGFSDATTSGWAPDPRSAEERRLATGVIDATLGLPRHAELAAVGAAMTDDDIVAYALAAIERAVDDER
jgi:hypothetical protein